MRSGALPRLLVIAGPTAVGKSELAVRLAKRWRGEVVSADSMQVYQGLNIGTAKPNLAERCGVPHHLLDVAHPQERFTVARFQQLAQAAVREIVARGCLPVLAGGSGLYIRALVQHYQLAPVRPDWERRAEMARDDGESLRRRLHEHDAAAAERLTEQDVPRLQRALEVVRATGRSIRDWEGRGPALYDSLTIGLTMPRARLYQLIEARVDRMLAAGWLEETAALLAAHGAAAPALQGLGYRQLVQHLQGGLDLPAAAAAIKQETRRLAKRQWTWFRREPGIVWIDLGAERDLGRAEREAVRLAKGKWPDL